VREELLAATQAQEKSQRSLIDRVTAVEVDAGALTSAQAGLREEVARQADELEPLKAVTQRTREALAGAPRPATAVFVFVDTCVLSRPGGS
jgi:hypothetical protein